MLNNEEFVEKIANDHHEHGDLCNFRSGLYSRKGYLNRATTRAYIGLPQYDRHLWVGGAIALCRIEGLRFPHQRGQSVGKALASRPDAPATRAVLAAMTGTRLSSANGAVLRLAKWCAANRVQVDWLDVLYALYDHKTFTRAQRNWAIDYAMNGK